MPLSAGVATAKEQGKMSHPFRYDWLGSIARIEAAGDDPAAFCLYCLPKAGVLLLNALLERARWRATYRGFGYDLSETEWTELTDIVDNTEIGLMANCDEIVNSIVTTVTSNVTSIVQNSIVYNDVCCFLETNPIDDPPASEEPPPGTGAEWEELCKSAQQAHDNGLQFLTTVFQYAEAGAGLTAGLIALLAAGLVTLPLAILAAFIGTVVALLADDLTDEALLEWEAIKKGLVCCIINASSAAAAKTCIDDYIDENVSTSATRSLFKTMYSLAAINQIWNGEIDGSSQSALYCADCYEGESLEVWGFSFDVIDFAYTGNLSDAGVKWGNGGSSGDLTSNSRAIAQDGVGDFFTTFQVISPDYEPEKCEVANCYPDGPTTSPASSVFAVLSVWKTAGAEEVTARLGNWKILVRPSGSTGNPYWIPTTVDHISNAASGVTMIGDELDFENAAWGDGQFGARVWFTVP